MDYNQRPVQTGGRGAPGSLSNSAIQQAPRSIGTLNDVAQSIPQALEVLEEQLKNLEGRLAPVLRNVPTTSPDVPQLSFESALADHLGSQLTRLVRLTSYVSSITNRVDF